MDQVEFGGSLYRTLGEAARAWAATALPDTTVIAPGEDATAAAAELEAFWHGEATRLPEPYAPDSVDEQAWREACRCALVARVTKARAA
jgi:hypothetical protein